MKTRWLIPAIVSSSLLLQALAGRASADDITYILDAETGPGGVVIHVQGGAVIQQAHGPLIIQGGPIVIQGNIGPPTANPLDHPDPPLIYPANHGYASDVPFTGPVTPLIDALRSTDFDKREEANRTLMRLSYDHLDEVRAALAKETDAEAVTRLTSVAAHLYLKGRTPLSGPGSILGIRLPQVFELMRLGDKDDELHATVEVVDLQPGYPAAQVLDTGDRIIAMDGKEFPSSLDVPTFRERLNKHPAGGTVQLTILRQGQRLDVGVQLAGVPEPLTTENTSGETALDQMVRMRNTSLALFLASLNTGIKQDPLVLKDKTPLESPNGYSFQEDIMVLPVPPNAPPRQ